VTVSSLIISRQTSSYDEDSIFQIGSTTELWSGPYSFAVNWMSWQRSFTQSSTFSYLTSTETKFTYSYFLADGWRAGTRSATSQEWQTLTRSTSWTEFDDLTQAIENITQTVSRATTTTGGDTTRITSAVTLTGSASVVDISINRSVPIVEPRSLYDFTGRIRFHQSMKARGYLGFGDGWDTTSPVYASLSTVLISGTSASWFHVNSELPKAVVMPEASVFVTHKCWLKDHPFSSTISASWVGTESGSRTSASLRHIWVSTATGMDSGGSYTTGTTYTALYGVWVVGTIDGASLVSEYLPYLYTIQQGTGRPLIDYSASGGGGGGGIAPMTSAPISATFPAGGVTVSWGTGTDTTSSASSTTSGIITMTFSTSIGAIGFKFEELMSLRWVHADDAQISTASAWHLPPYPFTTDLDT
jgi:hypothetical protein